MNQDNDLPYIGQTPAGYRYNALYPPDEKKYGQTYGGYANNARQVLLYDFAVQGYDVEFKFNGHTYHLLYEQDHAALCDSRYAIEYASFSNPMELIENLRIEGHILVDIIDSLEEVEPE